MKKIVIIGGFCLIVLLGLGAWFWSLGSLPANATQGIVLTVDQAPVEVRSVGGDWKAATNGMTLASSDEVRTGSTGRASIRFFGVSETRLHEDSDLALEQASQDAMNPSAITLQLKIVSGRAWSRILRLFDLDSSFTVHTDTVVATVRGTAFDMSADATGTTIWVSDSSVEMSAQDGANPSLAAHDPLAIPEGFKAKVGKNGVWGSMEPMTSEDMTSDWFLHNVNADQAFKKEINDALVIRLNRLGSSQVGGAFETLSRMSERMHLALAKDRAPELYGNYLLRRLFGIRQLIEQGKSGLAFQAFGQLEQDVSRDLGTPTGKSFVPAARQATFTLQLMLTDAGPSSPYYRLKQRLEDLSESLAADDPAAGLYVRLLAVDARLDEASALIAAGDLNDAQLGLGAAHDGITNVERDMAAPGLVISDVHARILRSKLSALKARELAMRTRLTTATNPPAILPLDNGATTSTAPTVSTTSTTQTSQTGQTPTGSTTTTTKTGATTSTVPEIPFSLITLSAQPNPVQIGDTAQLRVTGSRADGSSADLTARASFKLIGSLGSLNGPTYTSSQPGSITIQATVSVNGVVKTATTQLQINDIVKLSKIDVVPQGSTTVSPGKQILMVVSATYSSGLTSIVTPKVTWSTSDANIGSVSNGIFTAWINGNGPVTITGTYTENGVTKSASVVFTVSRV